MPALSSNAGFSNGIFDAQSLPGGADHPFVQLPPPEPPHSLRANVERPGYVRAAKPGLPADEHDSGPARNNSLRPPAQAGIRADRKRGSVP